MDTPNIPSPGDSLFFFTDDLPTMIDISAAGENQFWNYTSLRAPYLEFKKVEAAASGRLQKKFPQSDLLIVGQDGHEEYYAVRQNTLELLGGTKFEISNAEVHNAWGFDEGLPLDAVNLGYDEDVDLETVLSSRFNARKAPQEIQKNLGSTVDSVEITSYISRNIKSDAWGRVQIPGGMYEVLRYKVTDRYEHQFKIKSGSSAWEDFNSADYSDTNVSYHLVSSDYPQPVASIFTDQNNKPVRVQYMADSYQVRDSKTATPGQWLYAYPNPALSTVRFKFFDISPGKYKLAFYNILGKFIFEESYQMSGDEIIELNIGQLPKGTYLYSLVDPNGNKMVTKRLIVIKP